MRTVAEAGGFAQVEPSTLTNMGQISSDTEDLYFENKSNAWCFNYVDNDGKNHVYRVRVHAETKGKDWEAKVREGELPFSR